MLESNKIYLGDSLEFLKKMPDNYVDLLLVDPPYGIDYGNQLKGKINREDVISGEQISDKHGWKNYHNPEWDSTRPSKEYFDEMLRVSKNQIIWGGNYFTDYLYPSQGWFVWNKMQRGFSLADCELAWTSFDRASRIFDYARGSFHHAEVRIHPCLPKGNRVFIGKKWINIEEVNIGDETEYGNITDISSHYADKIVEIVVDGLTTTSTWNHPFLVKRGNDISWINAEQINTGDFILTGISAYSTLKPYKVKEYLKCKNDVRQKKATLDMQGMKKVSYILNIVLFGRYLMERFLWECRYIIKTLTKPIITLKTCNLSHPLNTSGITRVANSLMENGINRVKFAVSLKNAIMKIGIFLGDGLLERFVKSVLLKKALASEGFVCQKVGSVRIIQKRTRVYNLSVERVPVFETFVGLSHNTQKPLALIKWCLERGSKEGDLVLDPFSGSGTLAVACHEIGRKFICIEKDETYYNKSLKRLNSFSNQLSFRF